MKCEICHNQCRRRSKVIVEGKTLLACHHCVFKLDTHEVFYCEACGKYHFDEKQPLERMGGARSYFPEY